MDNEKQLLLIQIERERRRRKSATPTPAEPTWDKKAAEAVSGLAAGAAGGIPDLLSLPTRAVAGATGGVAKLAEMAGAGDAATKVKDFAFGVATQPSFTEKAQNAMNEVNEGYTKPTTAEGRAVQAGTQAIGSVLSGGAIKKGAEYVAAKGIDYAPRVAEAAKQIAKSRFLKFTSAATPAQVAGAGGSGAGAQFASEYAGDNPIARIAAPIAGAVAGGTMAGAGGTVLEKGISALTRSKAVPTGVGQSLIGSKGAAVDPDVPFAQLTGKVRAAAANELKGVRSKYKVAEQLAPQAVFNKSALGSLTNGFDAIAQASLDTPVKQIFENAANALRSKIEVGQQINVGDVARGLRRSFSELHKSSDGTKRAAGKEGVDFIDSFLDDAITNNRITNIGKTGIKAWQDATKSAKDYFTKFSDVDEVANIVAKDAKSNRKLLPSQVGTYFRPAAENSNVGNVWDATLNALPAGERAAANEAIRRGIMHKSLTSSLKQAPSGLVIDEPSLLNNLMTLRADKGAWSKFTPAQRASVDKLRAELARGKLDPKKVKNAITATLFAFTGRSMFGVGSAGAELLGGAAQAKIDDIIKLLDTPVELDKQGGAGYRRALLPAAVQQAIPDGQQQ